MQPWPEPRAYPPPPGRKTAIVTGGSQGIGKATAIALVSSGWNVIISGRRLQALEAAVEDIDRSARESGGKVGRVRCFQGDSGNEQAVVDLFEMAMDAFGQVDMIFINAGVSTRPDPIQKVELQTWQAVVDTNLTAAWLCARQAFRVMDGSRGPVGGRIILNGSISAVTPRPYSTPYSSTKSAISGLAKALALEGRQWNIAVSQLDIGNAKTDMTAAMGLGSGAMQADGSTRQEPVFDQTHAAREVLHIAEMPLEVNVQNVTIMATAMPSYIGRG